MLFGAVRITEVSGARRYFTLDFAEKRFCFRVRDRAEFGRVFSAENLRECFPEQIAVYRGDEDKNHRHRERRIGDSSWAGSESAPRRFSYVFQ